MSTTHHHSDTGPRRVLDLDEARDRRARSLLERRSQLGRRWAEALSHQLPGADGLAYEIAVVEEAISTSFPAIFDEHFADWILQDASKLHAQGAATGTCAICDAARGNPRGNPDAA